MLHCFQSRLIQAARFRQTKKPGRPEHVLAFRPAPFWEAQAGKTACRANGNSAVSFGKCAGLKPASSLSRGQRTRIRSGKQAAALRLLPGQARAEVISAPHAVAGSRHAVAMVAGTLRHNVRKFFGLMQPFSRPGKACLYAQQTRASRGMGSSKRSVCLSESQRTQ